MPDSEAKWSPSRPCPERDVRAWDVECDVCVVGFGAAGGSAAIEAAESGARVVLFEVASGFGGTSAMAGGDIYLGGGGGTPAQRENGFEDETEVWLRVVRLGEKSITYQFLFSLDGAEVARGEVSVACVRVLPDGGGMKGTRIPPSFRERISVHEGQRLDFGPPKRQAASPPEEESNDAG